MLFDLADLRKQTAVKSNDTKAIECITEALDYVGELLTILTNLSE